MGSEKKRQTRCNLLTWTAEFTADRQNRPQCSSSTYRHCPQAGQGSKVRSTSEALYETTESPGLRSPPIHHLLMTSRGRHLQADLASWSRTDELWVTFWLGINSRERIGEGSLLLAFDKISPFHQHKQLYHRMCHHCNIR